MIWYLMLIIYMPDNVTIHSLPFTSEKACYDAAFEVMQAPRLGDNRQAFCLSEGGQR